MDEPEVINTKSRSEGAKRMWNRRKSEQRSVAVMSEKKFDWHLLVGAAGIVITLATITIGSYISLLAKIGDSTKELSKEISKVNEEIIKIQTVLILKGVAPAELFAGNEETK